MLLLQCRRARRSTTLLPQRAHVHIVSAHGQDVARERALRGTIEGYAPAEVGVVPVIDMSLDEEAWADANECINEMHHVLLAELFGQCCRRPGSYPYRPCPSTPFSNG